MFKKLVFIAVKTNFREVEGLRPLCGVHIGAYDRVRRIHPAEVAKATNEVALNGGMNPPCAVISKGEKDFYKNLVN